MLPCFNIMVKSFDYSLLDSCPCSWIADYSWTLFDFYLFFFVFTYSSYFFLSSPSSPSSFCYFFFYFMLAFIYYSYSFTMFFRMLYGSAFLVCLFFIFSVGSFLYVLRLYFYYITCSFISGLSKFCSVSFYTLFYLPSILNNCPKNEFYCVFYFSSPQF